MDAQPPTAAVENGHDLEWDPPAVLTAASRWTCRRCSATAIDNRGVKYGSAVTDRCTTSTTERTDRP